jgi:hypothetical protein
VRFSALLFFLAFFKEAFEKNNLHLEEDLRT